jgi:hypothetical protein
MGNLSRERRLEILRFKINRMITLIVNFYRFGISPRKIERVIVKLVKYLREEDVIYRSV